MFGPPLGVLLLLRWVSQGLNPSCGLAVMGRCPSCGAPIGWNLSLLAAGVIICERDFLKCPHFVWMKSAQGWVAVPDGVKTVETQTQL